MKTLFQYVEDQWLESSLWSEKEWSVYRQSIMTNNGVEGIKQCKLKQETSNILSFTTISLSMCQECDSEHVIKVFYMKSFGGF